MTSNASSKNDNVATEQTSTENISTDTATSEKKVETAGGGKSSFEANPHFPLGRTIYIENLSTNLLLTYIVKLHELFKKYGEIKNIKKAGMIIDRPDTDVTFSAYVYFTEAKSSEDAMAENGTILDGRPISIHILRAGKFAVRFENLPLQMSNQCLNKLLSPCGNIKFITRLPSKRVDHELLSAFVEFEDDEAVEKAISLNNKLLINNVKVLVDKSAGFQRNHQIQKKKIAEKKRGKQRGGMSLRGGRGGIRTAGQQRGFSAGISFGGDPPFWGDDFKPMNKNGGQFGKGMNFKNKY